MGYTYIHVTASAEAGAGVSYGLQLSLNSQTPISKPPLTTSFTPPYECKTPLAFEGDCRNKSECDGSYMPFLYIPDSAKGGTSLQCYPEATTLNGGLADAVFDYSPGYLCPLGMTTATSIANVYLCCPSGLSYSYDGEQEQCTATMTAGTALIGPWRNNQATVVSTTSWSAADRMTLYVAAVPIYLTQAVSNTPNDVPSRPTPPSPGESSTATPSNLSEVPSTVSTSIGPECRRSGCQTSTIAPSSTMLSTAGTPTSITNRPGSDSPEASNQTDLKVVVGVSVGVGGTVALIVLVLGYIFLRRYRRKRLLNHHQLSAYSPPKGGRGGQAVQGNCHKKLPPELPAPESWVELEGTQVEGRGAGIYVWKPELEGTAGITDGREVYVRKKSELEANRNSATITPQTAGAAATQGSMMASSASCSCSSRPVSATGVV